MEGTVVGFGDVTDICRFVFIVDWVMKTTKIVWMHFDICSYLPCSYKSLSSLQWGDVRNTCVNMPLWERFRHSNIRLKYPGIKVFTSFYGLFCIYNTNIFYTMKAIIYGELTLPATDAITDTLTDALIEEAMPELPPAPAVITSITEHTRYMDCVGSLNFLS